MKTCCRDLGGVDFSIIYLHLKVKIMFPSCKEAVVSSRLFISFPRLPFGSVCRWSGVLCVCASTSVCVYFLRPAQGRLSLAYPEILPLVNLS